MIKKHFYFDPSLELVLEKKINPIKMANDIIARQQAECYRYLISIILFII